MPPALLPTGRLKRPPSHPLPSPAPNVPFSLFLPLTDTRRECSSSRETVIKYNRFVFVRRSWLKSWSWFEFTKFLVWGSMWWRGYSKVLSHSSTPYSDPSLAFRGTWMSITDQYLSVLGEVCFLIHSNTKKHAQESCLYFVWSNSAKPKVGLQRTADRCNTCTDSLESFAMPLEPVWPVNIMCCSLSITHLLQ